MSNKVTVIGGGLAGSASALELAARGVNAVLFEMRPEKMTPAHTGGNLAELVCSNSLGSRETFSANGLLMRELEELDSKLLIIAKTNMVPAGKALAINREGFAADVTSTIEEHPNIELVRREVTSIPLDSTVILASGPLTSSGLIDNIKLLTGEEDIFFFDATSPTVTLDSIDMSRAFWGNRRDPEGSDYLNCPLTVDEFNVFHESLNSAERVEIKDFEPDKLFESCLPIEIIGSRDSEALRFGPMKPVGLKNPDTGKGHYAIVQLRREDADGNRLNLVGFQTRLKYSEQKRVFRLIPALKKAEFVRLGHMHKNFFINAPKLLDEFLRLKSVPGVFLAGQITGGEGYLEAIAQGTAAGINAARVIKGHAPIRFPTTTMLGAFSEKILNYEGDNYQPLKVNFGMLPALEQRIRGKRLRREKLTERSLRDLNEFIIKHNPT